MRVNSHCNENRAHFLWPTRTFFVVKMSDGLVLAESVAEDA